MKLDEANGNGKRPTWHWIAATALSILVLAGAAWAGWMMRSDEKFDERIRGVGLRVGIVEGRLSSIESSQTLIQTQLNRIELRLDQVLSTDTHPTPHSRRR